MIVKIKFLIKILKCNHYLERFSDGIKAKYLLCSAKENTNIKEVFLSLTEGVLL